MLGEDFVTEGHHLDATHEEAFLLETGKHLAGEVTLAPVNPAPLEGVSLGKVALGHRSLAIDAILTDVLLRGLSLSLDKGLRIEAAGFGLCKNTVDLDIGMKNFAQNGPRVPACFLHE
jgi:enoyl-CoA hydratase/3-hydroxyacyl-CoA dehydrogenase